MIPSIDLQDSNAIPVKADALQPKPLNTRQERYPLTMRDHPSHIFPQMINRRKIYLVGLPAEIQCDVASNLLFDVFK